MRPAIPVPAGRGAGHGQRVRARVRDSSTARCAAGSPDGCNWRTLSTKLGLEPLGGNLYRETAASGVAVVGVPGDPGFGTIKQAYLESSNVDPVKEITRADFGAARLRDELEGDQAADEMAGTVSKGLR